MMGGSDRKKGALGGELMKLARAHGKLVHKTPPRCLGLVGARPVQTLNRIVIQYGELLI